MKRVALLLILAAAATSALAHGGKARVHVGLGFHFGVPLYGGWGWYGPPAYYYYPPPAYVQPPAPAVYVERGDVVPEGPGTWYFCRESNTYYPYVKQCPGGWTRVPAQPSN